MDINEIEKLNQLISRTDMSGNEKVNWLITFNGRLEKKQLIDFHIEVMKQGLINEGDKTWEESYEPKIRAVAEKVYEKLNKNHEHQKC